MVAQQKRADGFSTRTLSMRSILFQKRELKMRSKPRQRAGANTSEACSRFEDGF